MKKLILLFLIIVMSLTLLVSCVTTADNSNSVSKSEESIDNESVSDGSKPDEYEDVPREGATKEEAEQTKLLIDKDKYSIDDIVTLTIQCPFENDYISYAVTYIVEYYDETEDIWKLTGKEFTAPEVGIIAHGSATMDFKLSDRAIDVGDEYRVVLEATVNNFPLKLISDTFTIE